MLRRLPIPFSQFVSIMSFLVVTAACLDSDLFLLVNAEKEQKGYYLLHSISSLLFDNDVPDLYPGVAFVKELENLIKNFEYTFDLDGSQIFPNDDIKQDIISEYKSSNYNIDDLNYELLGFKIIASDIKILVDPKRIDDTKTRIDIPLLLAKDIKVSNGGLINLSYNEVELGSVYGIYDKATDKMSVHVPIVIAAKYI
ncbi:MAG: hypothetical protein K0S91_3170 [Nitrososphaeraceae archaeon]|jgi:hypothetical protein|nr:hypothetical protein [Nitrososphaeraceae archaeon]